MERKKFDPIVLSGPSILSAKDTDEINGLLRQLSDSVPGLSVQEASTVLSQQNLWLILLKDPRTNRIIAMATLSYNRTLRHPNGRGYLNDVVVDKSYRGLGLGEYLVKFAVATAKNMRLDSIQLTSNRRRVAANLLYLKHGFRVRDTNCFLLNLDESKGAR